MQLESHGQTSSIGMSLSGKGSYWGLTAFRCQVKPGTVVDPTSLILVTIDICTQTDNYILQDGFKSFPSGHSSGMLA